MNMMNMIKKFLAIIVIFLFAGLAQSEGLYAEAISDSKTFSIHEHDPSWIIKWKDHIPSTFEQESEILSDYPDQRITVARPVQPQRTKEWVDKWEQSVYIEYMQRNEHVTIANAPNDPLLGKQQYLQQIRAIEAWSSVRSNTSHVIAIVDTGVDLEHPDLKESLVPGINLLNPDQPPQDDNGHGTNVAGIIAATGNNSTGISGLLWNAKIMPIKALNAKGTGAEDKLGEGIRYAVDHGAKIVVLSLGLNKFTPYMNEIVQYAEERGVLLIAASGNEGNAVKYPAAYPTVLAVGGVQPDNKVDERSNFGLELDLVAPMNVFTTALGSGYEYKDGTSMAAPQVAAVSALVWSKYPEFEPYQIRNLLRQTAEPLGTPYWNPYTGYGLLRADRALNELYNPDMYEPNDTRNQGKPLPLGKMMSALLNGREDRDWFYIDAPYDGSVSLHISEEGEQGKIQVTYFGAGSTASRVFSTASEDPIRFPVKKGRNYVLFQARELSAQNRLVYHVTPQFHIYRDAFEDNDRQYAAFKLPLRNQTIAGTFDHMNDVDWYQIQVEKEGLLKVTVNVDTARMDPVLLLQRKGEKPLKIYCERDGIDCNGDGEPESTPLLDVWPGTYYIRVSNVKEYAYPVIGEYSLTIEYMEKLVDPNEPNDKPYQAAVISMDSEYIGSMDFKEDTDWFLFKLNSDSFVQIDVQGNFKNPPPVVAKIYDHELEEKARGVLSPDGSAIQFKGSLPTGKYYFHLSVQGTNIQMPYRLLVHADPLVAGFADIYRHWAAAQISDLARRGIVQGYGDYHFRPDERITRSEAVAFLVRAFRLTKETEVRYSDVPEGHWAYSFISRAAAGGIIEGYPDGRFGANQFVSRREMAVMIARALQMSGTYSGGQLFRDLSPNDWAAGWLSQMKAAGIIEGYDDGTFRPDQYTTRAEFVTLLSKALNR